MAKTFTDDSQRRIARVVIDHENEPRDLTAPPRVPRSPLPFQFRRFELKEPFALVEGETYQTAEAYFLKDDGTVEDGTHTGDRPSFTVTDILNTRFGLGNGELSSPYDRGSQGTCYHPHDVDRWEVVDMRAIDMMRFELKEALTPGGTVDAYYLDAAGSIQSGVVFEVTDVLGVHRGRANGAFSSPHHRGSQGYAWYMHDLERFEIMKLQPHALQIMGDLTADVSGGISFTMENVYVMQPPGAIITDTNPASSTFSVTNREFDGDEGDEAIATWDENDGDWKALDVMCPS